MSSRTGFKYGELVTPEEKNQIIKILKENEKKLNRMKSQKTRCLHFIYDFFLFKYLITR